jgi:prophage maintenance system killer protein
MASSLHYLTVQDVLWINLKATRKVHHFSYAKLEEATYYQYAYGESNTLARQAARFVTGFLKMQPFDEGNDATAFIGLLAFLRLNGRCIDLTDEDALAWFGEVEHDRAYAKDAIDAISHPSADHHHEGNPDVRQCILSVLSDYPNSVDEIVGRETAIG